MHDDDVVRARPVSGPGLAGIMVEILGAPMAVLVDSLSSFCVPVVCSESNVERSRWSSAPKHFSSDCGGFRYVGQERHIRALLCLITVNNFFMNAIMALIVFYATREIGFRPGIFGMAVRWEALAR